MDSTIWRQLCDAVKKKKGELEMSFEKGIAKDFLGSLDWSYMRGNLEEQYIINHHTKWRPDFVLFVDGKPEIIVELKKTNNKQRAKDRAQVSDYLKISDCRFGLYFGERLELFYLDNKGEVREVRSVLSVEYDKEAPYYKDLMRLIRSTTYNREALASFCKEQVEIEDACRYWQTPEGNETLVRLMMEHCHLRIELFGRFHAALDAQKGKNHRHVETPASVTTIPAKPDIQPKGHKEWLIPSNQKRFNLDACYQKYGNVYWRQTKNIRHMQAGDTGYIYSSLPHSSIRFSFEVIQVQMSYSKEMDRDDEFTKNYRNYEYGMKGGKFALLQLKSITNSPKLALSFLKKYGLKTAPQAPLCLSKESFHRLWNYIVDNFSWNLDNENSLPNKPKNTTAPHKMQLDFWTKFRDKLRRTGKIPTLQTPRAKSWYDVRIGRQGIMLSNVCNTMRNFVGVKLYIRQFAVETFYPVLLARKNDINLALGAEPEWDANPTAKDKTILLSYNIDPTDPKKMEEALEWLVKQTLIFYDVFSKEVKRIN